MKWLAAVQIAIGAFIGLVGIASGDFWQTMFGLMCIVNGATFRA